MERFNCNNLKTLLLIGFACFIFLFLPPTVSAFTSQCTFERWDGEVLPCSQQDSNNWPYKWTDNTTLYEISRLGETIQLPKIPELQYDFSNPYKISWVATVSAKNQFSKISSSYNQTHRVAILSQESEDLINFVWDEEYAIYQTEPIEGNLTKINETMFFTKEGNQLKAYFEKGWDGGVDYPVYIYFNSYVVNNAQGWNGTFTQTSLDSNESIILDYNRNLALYQDAISYWPMDPNINNAGTSATHILDFNLTSSNNCTFGGYADDIGWVNRSRRGNAVTQMNCGSDAELQMLNTDFSVSFWINMSALSAQYPIIGTKTTYNGNGWYLQNELNGRVTLRGNGDTPANSGTDAIVADTWKHIVFIFDSSDNSVDFYSNGVFWPDADDTAGAITTGGSAFRINDLFGAASTGFVGRIDEIAVWNRILTQQEVITIYNNSHYSTGNFTTSERNTTGTDLLINMSATFETDGSSSVDLFVTDTTTGDVQLVQSGAVSGTFYNLTTSLQNYTGTVRLNNGSTPHISQIQFGEGLDVITPNVTSMLPANNSLIEQQGESVNVDFSATCIDNVACDNATLQIWNSTFDPVTIQDVHFATDFLLLNGTGTSGALSDTRQDNGSYFIVQERGGGGNTECLNIIFNITSVPLAHDHTIKIDTRYNGGGGHTVRWYWRNFTNGQLVSFVNQTQSVVDEQFTSVLIPSDDSVSNGNFTVQVIHSEGGSACSAAHLLRVDLLELEGNNDIFDFVDGYLNTTIELEDGGQSPYYYIFTAVDTSGNTNEFYLGNYTFFVNATDPPSENIIIIQPFNTTYTEIDHPPIRLNIVNETEIDTIWYQLNEGDNVTIVEHSFSIYWPNTTLHDTDNGFYNLTVWINRTNGRENFSRRFFEVNNLGEVNITAIAEEVWLYDNRTTLNWFDQVVGGDIMTNEILFFLTIASLLIFLGFRTPGASSIPLFGMAGIVFVVLGLFIRDTTPYDLFAREIPFTDMGLMNLTAMWVCFLISVALFVYPTYLYSKSRNR